MLERPYKTKPPAPPPKPRSPAFFIEVQRLTPEHFLFEKEPSTRRFFTFLLFEKASGIHILNSQQFPASTWELLTLYPQQVYDARSVLNAEGWMVTFEPDALSSPPVIALNSLRLLRYTTRVDGTNSAFKLNQTEQSLWMFWVAVMERELQDQQVGFEEAIRAYLRLMFLSAARLAEPLLSRLSPQARPLLERVFEFIDTHYRGRISLKDVSEFVNRSRSHLTNVVRKETGQTVLSWIIIRRMVEARRLLLDTNQSVERVAETVGYGDTAHFIEQFRKTTGQTPAAWRKNIR